MRLGGDSWFKMLCADIQNCACYPHGEYIFRKIVKKNCRKGEECNRKALDGNCDGYMCGLGEADKRKSEKTYRFLKFFEGVKRGTGVQGRNNRQVSRGVWEETFA